MYPLHLFSLFPPFPRENKVFVAMSFEAAFDRRWNDVIAPAIRKITKNDVPLEPYRVDTSVISDSILTDIICGISNCEIVFADITTLIKVNEKPIRNSNVMYEVGLAHAVRLPEEVVLFRSDDDPIIFDMANIRINKYDPDGDPVFAESKIINTIIDALKERDLRKNLAIKKATEALDYACYMVLLAATKTGWIIKHPVIRTMGDVMGNASKVVAINKLLDLGLIRTEYVKYSVEEIRAGDPNRRPGEEILTYRVTTFGEYVLKNAVKNHGITEEMARKLIEEGKK